ncbi:hypothetical protein Tco_0894850 [Tanacetum coccineum]|uniref:Retrovirus-related Pol polyprotein from transposon TNT 1-94-like beta-barrel domain-containing protein n=1 Tax=Tanacetum coccineum TaxID=301880 RepID=A0ABQ5CG42_9ASTR
MLATKPMVQDDDVAWWVDSGATIHECKDRCWFKTYESLNDGSILHIGYESTTLVHGCGCVDLEFYSGKIVLLFNVLHVPNIRKNLVSRSVLNNCGYKKVIESNKFVLSKHEAINDEMDSIMGNNTWVLADLPPSCKPLGCKWIFKRKLKYYKTVDCYGINSQSDYSLDECEDNFLECQHGYSMKETMDELWKSMYIDKNKKEMEIAISKSHYIEKVLKKFNYFDCTLVSTLMDISKKLMPNNGHTVSQLEYSRVIGCLMYAMTCTRPDIAFDVGKLSRYTSNPGID